MAGEISPNEWGKIWAKAWLEAERAKEGTKEGIKNDDTFKRVCEYDPAAGAYAVRDEFGLTYTKILDLGMLENNYRGTYTVTEKYTGPELDLDNQNPFKARPTPDHILEEVIRGHIIIDMEPSEWNLGA